MPANVPNIRSDAPKRASRLTGSRSRILGLAGAAALGAVAATATFAPPTLAQRSATEQASVQTPFGRAPLSFADIVDKVKPAVVSISVRGGSEDRTAQSGGPGNRRGQGEGIPGLPDDHPLNEFFKNLPKEFRGQPGRPGGPRPSQAQGSGFVISADGYVVTNNHVIDNARQISVQFDSDEKYDAELIGSDQRTDLALLKIKAPGKTFPFVKFASKDGRVGDWVVAVGNPFGLGGTVTAGIVSALARDIGSGPYDYLQIDAAVNRGNSGGPTFNLDGEVVGVNTAIYSPSGGNVGIAFAVPAKTAVAVIEQLKTTGSVSRGWLGVKIQNVDEDIAASLALPEAKGALVNEVTANGPAAAAGLRVGDAILSVNGQRINDSRDLARRIAEFNPNVSVDVLVLRGGREQTVPVKLGQFPRSTEEVAKVEEPKQSSLGTEMSSLGLTLLPPGGRNPVKDGVAIAAVADNSDAGTKGLRAGDIILEVNSTKVTSPAEVEAAVKAAQDQKRNAVLLNIRSGTNTRIVAVRLNAKG